MPSVERMSSKVHICHRSIASRPTAHCLDSLSALSMIMRYTSGLKGFYLLAMKKVGVVASLQKGIFLLFYTSNVHDFLNLFFSFNMNVETYLSATPCSRLFFKYYFSMMTFLR